MVDTFLAKDHLNHAIQALAPDITQTVAFSGTSAATANALGKHIVVIRVLASADCFIKIDTGTPTATTSDTPLAAGVPEYFRVDGYKTIKVAAVQSSTSGNLYVTEMI